MKLALTAGLIAIAAQANALDCLIGDAATAYQEAKTHRSDFQPVIGALEWGTPDVSIGSGVLMMDFEGQTHDVPARFSGVILGENGERIPVDRDIRVIALCLNGDCGYARSGYEILSFLHSTPDGAVMYSLPCQNYPMAATVKAIEMVQDCLDDGPCTGARDR